MWPVSPALTGHSRNDWLVASVLPVSRLIDLRARNCSCPRRERNDAMGNISPTLRPRRAGVGREVAGHALRILQLSPGGAA